MRISSHSKIYIICPANNSTGGPEALHQLSHKLKTVFGYEVSMFYINKKKGINPKPEAYNIYFTQEALEINPKKRKKEMDFIKKQCYFSNIEYGFPIIFQKEKIQIESEL